LPVRVERAQVAAECPQPEPRRKEALAPDQQHDGNCWFARPREHERWCSRSGIVGSWKSGESTDYKDGGCTSSRRWRIDCCSLKSGTLYGNWLLELASHGYIVVADGPPTEAGSDPTGAGMRAGADGKVLVGAIEWLIKENDRPCSRFYQKVATTKLAVAGQSCGGLMAMYSAGDKRITTAVIGNSGLFAADQATYSALHSPIVFLIGGSSDIAYSNAERDYMNINHVPTFNANMDTGHGGTWNSPNGGEFGRVGKAWLDWQLKGDMAASKLFSGADCEILERMMTHCSSQRRLAACPRRPVAAAGSCSRR
jgi:hypothetical protein